MFICFGIIALIVISGSDGQDSCSVSSGVQGACISVLECNSILNISKKTEGLQSSELEALKKSQCGYEGTVPKVCCPSSTEVEVSVPPDLTKHPNLRFINDRVCGPYAEDRIIQGSNAMLGQYPWMVLIGRKIDGQDPEFKCGGSLISRRYVLTAANCVTESQSPDPGSSRLSIVRLGEHDLSEEIDCVNEFEDQVICADKHRDYLIETFHTHDAYVEKTGENDVALIRTAVDVEFRTFGILPICLPIGEAVVPKSGTEGVVTGWGGNKSQKLLRATLRFVPNNECARFHMRNGVDISYKQLCAEDTFRTDFCKGDNGGPVQSLNLVHGTVRYVQYGVVGFGSESCGAQGDPGVYTSVAYCMDWILDTIAE